MDQRKIQQFLSFQRYVPNLYSLPSMPDTEYVTPGLNPNRLYEVYTDLHENPENQFLAETKEIPKDQVGRGKNDFRATSPITIQNIFEKMHHPAYRQLNDSDVSDIKTEGENSNTEEDSKKPIEAFSTIGQDTKLHPFNSQPNTPSTSQGATPEANIKEENLPLSQLRKKKKAWQAQEDTAKFSFY